MYIICYIVVMYNIHRYKDAKGSEIITKWLLALRDDKAVFRIAARLEQIRHGNFGDCKFIRSSVWELRIDIGAGYRIYYSIVGKEIILLLVGGDKRSQKRDIEKAINYLEDYNRRGKP